MTPEQRRHIERAGLALAAVALLVFGFSAGRSSAASLQHLAEPPAPRACQCEPAWVRAELAIELLSDCRQALLECMARGGR